MTVKTYIPSWWGEGCNELSSNDPIMKSLINKFNDTNFTGGQILLENGSNLLLEDGNAIDMESGVNPFGTPDPTATFDEQIFIIDRKSTENRDVVEFELAATYDIDGVRLPKRQVLPADFPGIGTFFS